MIKTLLVEHDPVFSRLLKGALATSSVGFQVEDADTLATAIARLGAERFNVVLLDLNLPDSTGIATIEAIYAATSSVPIVMLTEQDDDSLIAIALTRGAQSFLRKDDLTTANLLDAMRCAVQLHRQEEERPQQYALRISRACRRVREDLASIQQAIALMEANARAPTDRDAIDVVRSRTKSILTSLDELEKNA